MGDFFENHGNVGILAQHTNIFYGSTSLNMSPDYRGKQFSCACAINPVRRGPKAGSVSAQYV
jgi:hypothetical protein